MSVATNHNDDFFQYRWEDESGHVAHPKAFTVAQAFCGVMALATWVLAFFEVPWGPKVSVFGQEVMLAWPAVVFPVAVLVFARGLRARFGGTVLAAVVLTLGCVGMAIAVQLAFGAATETNPFHI